MHVFSQYIKSLFIFWLTVLVYYKCISQPGQLDSGFNGNGILYDTRFNGFVYGNLVYPNGDLLMGGNSYFNTNQDIIFSKYNKDGSPKLSFGTTGIKRTDLGRNEELRSMTFQQDGKILVAGYFANVNTPDSAFLIRYLTNGELDSSFGVNGIVISSAEAFYDARLLPDGRIMVCGKNTNGWFLARYTANGVVDHSFANQGMLFIPYAYGLTGSFEVQADGKLVMAGGSNNKFRIMRFLADGSPDVSFNESGFNETFINNETGFRNYGDRIKIQPDQKIIMSGMVNHNYGPCCNNYHFDLGIVRYLPDGNIDSSFGNNGIFITNFNLDNRVSGVAFQADQKILLSGTTGNNLVPEGDYFLMRLFSNGNFDSSFGVDGKMTYPTYGESNVLTIHDSSIYLSGWSGGNPMFTTMVIKNNGVPLSPYVYKMCPGSSNLALFADFESNTYQWQVSNNNTIFQNLTENTNYQGVNNSMLSISNISSAFNENSYRCISPGDTSKIFSINIENTWTGNVSNNWNDPGNWGCGQVPDSNTNVRILSGSVILNNPVSIHSLEVSKPAAVLLTSGNKLSVLKNNNN